MKIEKNKIILRDFKESDIELAVHYWTDPSEKTIYPLVKKEMRGNKDHFRAMFKNFLEYPERKKMGRVIEYDGVTVGSINLTDLKENKAHLHGHFWNKDFRGKGLGIIVGAMVAKWLIKENNLEGLFICPPVENPMSSRIPQKLGLIPIKTNVELPYPMIESGILGHIYYIKKEQILDFSNNRKKA